MEETVSILEASLLRIIEFIPQIISSVFIIILMFLLGKFFGNVLLRFLLRSSLSATHRNFFRKIVIWIFSLIGVAIVLNVLDLQAASVGLLTGGGITALAIGIAFRDIGENILAGIYLAFNKPFNTGDLISTGELEGLVQEVELRHTHIRTYDGTDIFIPNAQIFNQPLLNLTMDGLRRHSFTIGIDYTDNAKDACLLLMGVVSKVDKVLYDPACVVSISGFTSQYVELKVFFWINTFDKKTDFFDVKSNVMECCRKTLNDNNYTFSSNVENATVLSIPKAVKITSEGH